MFAAVLQYRGQQHAVKAGLRDILGHNHRVHNIGVFQRVDQAGEVGQILQGRWPVTSFQVEYIQGGRAGDRINVIQCYVDFISWAATIQTEGGRGGFQSLL